MSLMQVVIASRFFSTMVIISFGICWCTVSKEKKEVEKKAKASCLSIWLSVSVYTDGRYVGMGVQLCVHCKDKMPKIWKKYSQKRNIGVSVPISIYMCLWANYIFSRWVCVFCWRKYVDQSLEYINRSQTHECGNWGWGRAIPRKGIYNRNCRCSVWGKVYSTLQ